MSVPDAGNGYVGLDRRARQSQPASDLWTQRFTAWGSMAVTIAIFALLAYNLVATSGFEDKQAFNGMNETIKAMAMIAVGFWLGSSNSKQKQDDALASTAVKQTETNAAAITALATSVPSSAVPTTTTTSKVDAAAGTAETVTEAAGNSNETNSEQNKEKDQ